MKLNKKLLATGVLAASLFAGQAYGAVSAAEAAKLGDSLTPMGAEKAGNGGEIPAWTGGLTTPPANYKGDGIYVNPFPDEKPKFTINQSNVAQYEDKLSPGQVAMIKQYDDYFMPVYETHRTAAYPKDVMDDTVGNATKVELIKDGNGLGDYQTATPFPIPQNGLEAIWNHITRYRGGSVQRNVGQVTPTANGDFSVVKFQDELTWRTYLEDYEPGEDPNVLFYFKQAITGPARLAGNVLLVHETIDQVAEPRRAWVYNAGQRRVRRAPQVAYDGPGTASDGMRTSDNFDMFNGAPDRYNWELVGKKEMYIPYNSYKLVDPSLSYDQIIKAGHINQDLTRYELHRVWHVRATLKEGERHIYAQRDFYIDEDTWQASVIDHYDGRGELWRVAEAHALQFYDQVVPWYAIETLYDLLSGRYLALGLTNEETNPYEFGVERQSRDYTPAALRRAGTR
ncbi:outer membrane lipoprotein-sorting protein [Marinobacter salinus]|uniref:Outer membrane lipoprotein-sorting protein n=1 Tax=Marinobacter salinus TaxID=1874317 RepID=A0A1D9GHI2_9GAMM|nr:DUF1329 domain-containing protein [Marinobacter salinus]AOY87106.1 outer membrane lipoprotein-sorting protein [Marinobacter salinus]